MTIQVLSSKQVPARAIARQLGVTEGAVRYHHRLAQECAKDGRKEKPFAASSFEPQIEAWLSQHARDDRPVNARDLYEHLSRHVGYPHSYKSVLRYLRGRFGPPAIRTYRRVETVPGAQVRTDWGEFSGIDLGDGPHVVHAFAMSHTSRAFAPPSACFRIPMICSSLNRLLRIEHSRVVLPGV